MGVSLDRFRERCAEVTVNDLIRMHQNAQIKGAAEFVHVAEEALNRRFPGWNRGRTRSTPTRVRFGGEEQLLQSAKEAYVWLIEKFVANGPSILGQVDWSTRFVAEGTKRSYFARSSAGLFLASPHLAKDRNNYHELSNGWYAILNLNNEQKFSILCRFAAVVGVEFEKQWYWEVV